MSRWARRPLQSAQVNYAACDALGESWVPWLLLCVALRLWPAALMFLGGIGLVLLMTAWVFGALFVLRILRHCKRRVLKGPFLASWHVTSARVQVGSASAQQVGAKLVDFILPATAAAAASARRHLEVDARSYEHVVGRLRRDLVLEPEPHPGRC